MTIEEIKAEITRVSNEAKRGPAEYKAKHHARIDELLDQLEAEQAQARAEQAAELRKNPLAV